MLSTIMFSIFCLPKNLRCKYRHEVINSHIVIYSYCYDLSYLILKRKRITDIINE